MVMGCWRFRWDIEVLEIFEKIWRFLSFLVFMDINGSYSGEWILE